MVRKQSKQGKKRVVLSLAEFNEDAGLGGTRPELSSLPSAPKAPEQWEAEGGRPEYNSRGYKERNQMGRDGRPSRGDNDDFDDRDWSRRGPMDATESSFGAPAGERDWGGMRGEGVDGEAQPERDWNGMRRGPVDAAFEGRSSGGADRDWTMRKGPVEAEVRGGRAAGVEDGDWGAARRQTVDSSFSEAPADRDWSVRKPVEADERDGPRADADWNAPRKGPVESDFGDAAPSPAAPRDWGVRKGPVEPVAAAAEPDWGGARGRAPVDAEAPPAAAVRQVEPDWKDMRRAPVESRASDDVRAPGRAVDFTDMRRGARLGEEGEGDGVPAMNERSTWRRDGGGVPPMGRRDGGGVPAMGRRDGGGVPAMGRRGRGGFGGRAAPAPDGGRDWGAARRGDADGEADGEHQGDMNGRTAAEWTTVRANPKRVLPPQQQTRQSPADDGGDWRNSRGGTTAALGRETGDARASFGTDAKTHTSPVTPVTSATSES